MKDILYLGLDRDLVCSQGRQGHWGYHPHDDDNDGKDGDEVEDNDKYDNNNKDDNNDKSISALGLDRDMWFSRGHQGHQPHDDDNKEEDNDKVEDNDKNDNNNKDKNKVEAISVLGLDRDMGFSQGHQGHQPSSWWQRGE